MKYIVGMIEWIWAIVRLSVMKLWHGGSLRFSWKCRLSPFAELSFERGTKVSLGAIRIRSGARLRVRRGAELTIADGAYINHGCFIVAHERITLGKDVTLSPRVMIYDHDHDVARPIRSGAYRTSPIHIGDDCWIGTQSVILRGTVLGDRDVVGAGSVLKGSFGSDLILVQKRETETRARNQQS